MENRLIPQRHLPYDIVRYIVTVLSFIYSLADNIFSFGEEDPVSPHQPRGMFRMTRRVPGYPDANGTGGRRDYVDHGPGRS